MLLKVNKLVQLFFVFCFLWMAVPYFMELGINSLFIKDFYAKRLMTIFSAPFFLIVVFLYLKNKPLSLNSSIVIYIFIIFLEFINALIFGNSFSLICLDVFIVVLPIIFYILVFKVNFEIKPFTKSFWIYLFIACFLVLFNIKLQFSYFSLIGLVYLIFLSSFNTKTICFLFFLPFLAKNTFIGKSALVVFSFITLYFFVFDKNLISKQKKIYLALVPSVLIIIGSMFFWDTIKETGTYKNTSYFLRHADFNNLKFTDMSTSHRLFEAEKVFEIFNDNNLYKKVCGNGFGATIDLSETNDVAVKNSNSNLSKVRHIHIGFFAVLHRYGVLGLVIYFVFIFKTIRSCRKILLHCKSKAIVLASLYVLILIFDSFITFPHMMSNFLFWFFVYVILNLANKTKEELKALS